MSSDEGPSPLISVDRSIVRAGKLEELMRAIDRLVEFVDEREPRPIAYQMYLDEDGTKMTVVQVHPDSASMEFHMQVAARAFEPFQDLLQLSKIDVYGKPSQDLLQLLRRKAQLLGNAVIEVHEPQAGFIRLAPVIPSSRA
jgi:quinol monooxygenase YgiN